MTAVCFTPFKVPRVRITKLNSCGQVVTGSCSQVVSDGIISIAMTKNYEAREEFFIKNGDGKFCVRETTPPILKWIDLVLTFCNVDPDILNIATGNALYTDENSVKIGWSTGENAAFTSYFALEGWTRLSGTGVACTGGTPYGYTLFPRIIEGTIGDMTLEDGVANFVINARTAGDSLWGVGPYNVSNNAVTGLPQAMNTPILSDQHHRMFITNLAPPASACGCASV